VGGSGLYLRALLRGLSPGPGRSEELRRRLRLRAQQRGPAYLHRLLRRRDPVAAAGIHPNDISKLVRALEVCLTARRPISQLWQSGRDPLLGFRLLKIGLNPPRHALYERINQRADWMFRAGLIEETERLLRLYPGAWALDSLGYRQAARFLRGELTREQALAAVQQAHRNYAKRQMTWFRHEPQLKWLDGFGEESQIQTAAAAFIEALRSEPKGAPLRFHGSR
jgi:tRNA dimethylallyltransferase